MSRLPSGWTSAQIWRLGELRLGKMLDRAKNQGKPTQYLRNVNVRWFSFDLEDLNSMLVSEADRDTLSIRDGDLIVCEGGEPGRAAVWNGGGNALVYQKALHRFRSNGSVLARWLMYQLKHLADTRSLQESITGTTIKHLTQDSLRRLHVLIAPFGEQRRVVGKLDSLVTRTNACRDRLTRVADIVKRFRESVLDAAVSGQLTAEWRRTSKQSHCGKQLAARACAAHQEQAGSKRARRTKGLSLYSSSDGESATLQNLPETWGLLSAAQAVEPGAEIVYGIVQPGPKLRDGIPYVRGMDIEEGKILVSQLMRTSPAIAARYGRASIKGGDVLLGIIRATKVAVVPAELDGANITQGTARLRPSRYIRSQYLAHLLAAPKTQQWLHDCYRGIDMPGLNLADVRRLPIPLPSIEEQDEIIRRVDELFEIASVLQRGLDIAKTRIDELTPSILAKAFRGELLPQDSVDEPANLLLEKIGTARKEDRPKSSKITAPPAKRSARHIATELDARTKREGRRKVRKLATPNPNVASKRAESKR